MATKLIVTALLVLLLTSCASLGSGLTGYHMTSLSATPSVVAPGGVVRIESIAEWFGVQNHDDMDRPPYYLATAGTFFGESSDAAAQWLAENSPRSGAGKRIAYWVAPDVPGSVQISGWMMGPSYEGEPPDQIVTIVVR